MSSSFIIAVQISILGMSLVFAAIAVLWVMLNLLVRFTSERKTNGSLPEDVETLRQIAATRRRRAAMAAVAAALAREASRVEPHEFPLPPTEQVSPWQAVMRTRILSKRGRTR